VPDTLEIAHFFRTYTGLDPQLVTDVRTTECARASLVVWSVMTEQGHFYVIQGLQREVLRAGRALHARDACRRYLELHPDELPDPA
jgi:hypothetical protein